MDTLIQQTINALSLGGVYALLALGLAVVFSIVRLINFAHGEIMTVAGYAIWVSLALHAPVAAAVALGLGAAALSAVAMERVAFRAMRGASVTTLLITSFAVSEIVKVLFQNGISARPVPIALPAWLTSTLDLGVARVGMISVVSILATLGLAMRAAAEDFAVVRLMGVRANQVVALAFAISGLLAGVAAILWVAQRGSVDPLMGATPVLKAFIATVLGGLGSLPGAVLGGFVVGAVEVFLQGFLPEAAQPFREAIALSLVIGLLVWRPNGLMPAPGSTRS
jgi:branched-chain amino acid transport system permease protein